MNDEFGNAKRALDEEWAMSPPNLETTKLPKIADAGSAPEQDDFNGAEEIITIVRGANGAGAGTAKEKEDGWKMPEPVFRVSSGKTPDKIDKPNSAAPTDLPFAKAIALENNAAAAPVQAQPNISAEFTVRHASVEQSAENQPKTLSILMLVLGILAIVVFAVAFLAAVYFCFYKTAA